MYILYMIQVRDLALQQARCVRHVDLEHRPRRPDAQLVGVILDRTGDAIAHGKPAGLGLARRQAEQGPPQRASAGRLRGRGLRLPPADFHSAHVAVVHRHADETADGRVELHDVWVVVFIQRDDRAGGPPAADFANDAVCLAEPKPGRRWIEGWGCSVVDLRRSHL